MASHLLWFDAAGAATLGIASLPGWLEAIEAGQVDPKAVGRVVGQRSALAVFDGENGLPLLLLERAAELAVETARETAVGLVLVDRVGPIRSAAAVTAGIALGPMAGLVLGPNRLWSLGLPSEAGLPVVVDSGLAAASGPAKPGGARTPADSPKSTASRRTGTVSAIDLLDGLGLGTEVLVPAGGWLVAAVSAAAVEPLAAFHQRVAAAWHGRDEAPGRLLPDDWDARCTRGPHARHRDCPTGLEVAQPMGTTPRRRGPRPARSAAESPLDLALLPSKTFEDELRPWSSPLATYSERGSSRSSRIA